MPTHNKFSEAIRAEVVSHYQDGWTLDRIMKHSGIKSPGTLYNILHDAGIELKHKVDLETDWRCQPHTWRVKPVKEGDTVGRWFLVCDSYSARRSGDNQWCQFADAICLLCGHWAKGVIVSKLRVPLGEQNGASCQCTSLGQPKYHDGKRWCTIHKIYEDLDSFGWYANNKDELHPACKRGISEAGKIAYRTNGGDDSKERYQSGTKRISTVLSTARSRAKKRGVPFALTKADVPPIPDTCPILGIPLHIAEDQADDNSASLDCMDPSKGYVPENIWWISYKANTMKSDADIPTLQRFGRWTLTLAA